MRVEKRRFRPMGIADILDEVVDLYKGNFVLLLGVAAILYVPITIVMGLARNPASRDLDWTSLAMFIPEAIVTGALAFGISERYLGKTATITQCYQRVFGRRLFFPLLGALAIKDAIVLGPMLLAITMFNPHIPANATHITPQQTAQAMGFMGLAGLGLIWALLFGTKFLLVEPSLVVESGSAFASLARSWRLTRGCFWKAFGTYLIIGIVIIILLSIIVWPMLAPLTFKIARGEAVTRSALVLPTIIQTILMTLMLPVLSASRILLYYDARIRKEAFDLEMLANELDQKTSQLGPGEITALPQERVSEPSADGEPK